MADTNTRRTIGQFKSQLAGGGARPNLFEVELTNDAVKGRWRLGSGKILIPM